MFLLHPDRPSRFHLQLWLLSSHHGPLWGAWLCLLGDLLVGIAGCCYIPQNPSLLQAEHAQIPQPLSQNKHLAPDQLGDPVKFTPDNSCLSSTGRPKTECRILDVVLWEWREGDSHSPGSPGRAPLSTYLVAVSLLCSRLACQLPAPPRSISAELIPSQSRSSLCCCGGFPLPMRKTLVLPWLNFRRLLVARSFILSRSLWTVALSSRLSTGVPPALLWCHIINNY